LKRNLYQVRARADELYVFADADTHPERGTGIQVIRMPEHCGELSPILTVVALQMLVDLFGCQIRR
jgi:glucosamine--fructose-6-phosphate aminotransferase (isomerizing)